MVVARPGQTLIGYKNYYFFAFEAAISFYEISLLRPFLKGDPARAGVYLFKPVRQIIVSVNYTF